MSVDAATARARLKAKMERAALEALQDPNLPSAFKVANSKRLAFAKQQARRKNNDTFMSLNSSHVSARDSMSQLTQTEYEEEEEYIDDDDDNSSSFASMADGDGDDDDSSGSYFEEIVEESEQDVADDGDDN
jgi:hypothetical protein